MMEAEIMRSMSCIMLGLEYGTGGRAESGEGKGGDTYNPCITSPSIHKPSGYLASSLDDQEGTETLHKLENRARISQGLVPSSQGHGFQQTPVTEEPFGPGSMVLLSGEAAHGPGDPVGAIRIDGETVQGPYQQAGYDEPLGGLESLHEGPS